MTYESRLSFHDFDSAFLRRGPPILLFVLAVRWVHNGCCWIKTHNVSLAGALGRSYSVCAYIEANVVAARGLRLRVSLRGRQKGLLRAGVLPQHTMFYLGTVDAHAPGGSAQHDSFVINEKEVTIPNSMCLYCGRLRKRRMACWRGPLLSAGALGATRRGTIDAQRLS